MCEVKTTEEQGIGDTFFWLAAPLGVKGRAGASGWD